MDLKLKDNPELKLGITQLEYIESTGTQYIQTNFSLNLSNKIHCKVKENTNNPNGGVPFACTWEQNKMYYLQYHNSSPNYLMFAYGSTGGSINSIDTNIHEFILNDNGKIYVDNVEKLSITSQNVSLSNFRIFDILVPNSSTNYKFTGRIYFIEIYDGTTLLHNFIPVKDNSNVVCFYDTVSQTFFYNQGTGDFVAGPVVGSIIGPITEKITTLYHKNCPNIDGYATLKSIQSAQSSLPAVQKLNRVRVEIGNVSGSISELMQYSTLSGFNDAYEHQTKPRLVGTWTINDWYTTTQLAQAQAAFDGLTIVGDPNYIIDFSQMAVQVLDPNEDNYNPAVAIILQGQNLGTTMNYAPLGYGRWFLSKTQAANIVDVLGWFAGKDTVTDTVGIVTTNTTQTYDFETFEEFEYFGVTSIGNEFYTNRGFNNCTKLKSITIPTSVAYIIMTSNANNNAAFKNCSGLETIIFKTTSFELVNTGIFLGCTKLKSIDLSNCTSTVLNNDTFLNCSSLESIILPPNLTNIKHRVFSGCTSLNTTITIKSSVTSLGGSFGGTFSNSGIKELIIENGLTSWTSPYSGQPSYGLCYNCSKLEKLVLPTSLTVIRHYSFYNCSKLSVIFCYATTPPTLESTNAFTNNNNLKIYVGDGSSAAHDNAILADYASASNWSLFASKLDTVYNYLHPQS